MTTPTLLLVLATFLGAAGLWLLLPGHRNQVRVAGLVPALASLGLFAAQIPSLGSWASDMLFWILAGVTIAAAVGTITFRSPVYCAIWFALSLLGTAALFLFQGSQFLAVATIVVYAGAILVTFLFVLMLAQPKGQATYDRVSWEGLVSASAGAVMVGILTLTLGGYFQSQRQDRTVKAPHTEELGEILADRHVEHLGAQLFSRHLISVEVAGTLLLVALVGAIAIAARTAEKAGTEQVGSAVRE